MDYDFSATAGRAVELDLRGVPEPASIQEVAGLFRISTREVKGWVECSQIQYCQIGREVRISHKAILDFWRRFSINPRVLPAPAPDNDKEAA